MEKVIIEKENLIYKPSVEIVKVERWKTFDGELFGSEMEAIDYEKKLLQRQKEKEELGSIILKDAKDLAKVLFSNDAFESFWFYPIEQKHIDIARKYIKDDKYPYKFNNLYLIFQGYGGSDYMYAEIYTVDNIIQTLEELKSNMDCIVKNLFDAKEMINKEV